MNKDRLLRAMFDAAVAAADPALRVPPYLPELPKGRTIVIGAGKASAAMALAIEQNWKGPLEGLVITRYGHGAPCKSIEIVEAAHPVPDEAGRNAAMRMGKLVRDRTRDDLLLCVISGGGSALLAAPAEGLTLADKQSVNRQLLACGAPISEMNTVRKHLSALKGGRLAAAAHPAKVVSLIISDVPGDDPAVVASGPTVADPSTREEAIAIIRKYELDLPKHVWLFLDSEDAETPKPGDPRFANVETHLIATPAQSLAAAAKVAREAGYMVIDLGDRVEGEARIVAQDHAKRARETKGPAVILSGGETTVTIKGVGRGGRNGEYALALAVALDGAKGIAAIAGDTDGIDGSEENAGAIIRDDTLARARALGFDAQVFLTHNDSYGFFARLGDLLVTGPTRTNVNDIRAIVIDS
jgi:glycerate 2-kinase